MTTAYRAYDFRGRFKAWPRVKKPFQATAGSYVPMPNAPSARGQAGGRSTGPTVPGRNICFVYARTMLKFLAECHATSQLTEIRV